MRYLVALWRGALFIVATGVTWVSLFFTVLVADECRQFDWPSPMMASVAGTLLLAGFWLGLPNTPQRVRLRGLLLIVLAALGLSILTLELTRDMHSLCHTTGHWAPNHVHSAEPAGDVGQAFGYLLTFLAASIQGVLGMGLLLASFFTRSAKAG